MTAGRYLIGVTFGPVQGFIAAARRTRDLWFGSWLLSEIAKSGAAGLLDCATNGKATAVELIFPGVARSALGDEKLSVANKLIAVVETGEPADCLRDARNAAVGRWTTLAKQCASNFGWGNIEPSVWSPQVEDFVECYGAWVALSDDYKASIERLNQLLAARKATREFLQPAIGPTDARGYGRKKSSLDPSRESVFKGKLSDKLLRQYGINPGEHLDAPGLVKRVLGAERDFTALARVACEPWVRALSDRRDDLLKTLVAAHEALVASRLVTRARRYERFPYDGQLAYSFRVRQLLKAGSEEITEQERHCLNQILVLLREIADAEIPPPDPYVAVLLADGDRMGGLISASRSATAHQQISRQLAAFAGKVPALIRDHGGECVYAGGDDVLAFVPAAYALACADELARTFADTMNATAPDLPETERPTLSVGIAFGHFLTPLGELRALAARAERIAKDGCVIGDSPRNALGVLVAPRRGASMELRGRWDDTAGGAFADHLGLARRLMYWAKQFKAETLSDRAGYQLRELVLELGCLPAALSAETKRLIGRKGKDSDVLQRMRDFLEKLGKSGPAALRDEWLVARWLAGRHEELGQ